MSWPARRAAVLRSLCAALRGEVGEGGLPPQPRRVRPVGWDEVLAMAFEQEVVPSLWEPLRARSVALPPIAAEPIHDEYRATAVQNLRFRRQLREAAVALNRVGIVPLLFKGALQLVDGTGSIAHRRMCDLDLAVPAQSIATANAALEGIGYQRSASSPFEHPTEVQYSRPGAPGPLDMHVELLAPVAEAVLPAADAWAQSTSLSLDEANMRGLSATHQVLHNVLHAAVQDYNHTVRGLPLRQLIVLTRLVRMHAGELDWAQIERRMAAYGLREVLRDHLRLTDSLIGLDAPTALLDGTRWRLHERAVIATFALGWPADLQRNLRYAFGATYLDSLYHHGDRRSRLALARARHAARLLRRDGGRSIERALQRRV